MLKAPTSATLWNLAPLWRNSPLITTSTRAPPASASRVARNAAAPLPTTSTSVLISSQPCGIGFVPGCGVLARLAQAGLRPALGEVVGGDLSDREAGQVGV